MAWFRCEKIQQFWSVIPQPTFFFHSFMLFVMIKERVAKEKNLDEGQEMQQGFSLI